MRGSIRKPEPRPEPVRDPVFSQTGSGWGTGPELKIGRSRPEPTGMTDHDR